MSKELETKFKQSEDYRKYTESQETKLKAQQEALTIQAENKVRESLRASGYEGIEISDIKANISPELVGEVKVFAKALKDTKNYIIKFPVTIKDGLVLDADLKAARRAEVAEDLESTADINVPATQGLIYADLSEFKLEDDGTPYYKVYHPVFDDIEPIGSISKEEYNETVNKKPLLVNMLRAEANAEGIDIRFAGQFVLPKIEKTSTFQTIDKKWEKSVTVADVELTPGVNVDTEYGEGIVENIISEKGIKKIFVNIQGRKIALGEDEVKPVIQKQASLNMEDDREKITGPDAVRQYTEREQLKTAKQVEALTIQTERETVTHLRGLGFEDVKLHGNSRPELEERRSGYNGTIFVNVVGSLDNESKSFEVPVKIQNDARVFPDKSVIMQAFKISDFDFHAKIQNHIDKEVANKVDEVAKYAEWHEKETEAVLQNLDKDVEIKKEASSVKAPKTVEYAPILHISKDVLPEGLEVGDVISISGARYRVTDLDTNSISREKDSGYVVTLELVPSKSSNEEGVKTSYTN